MVTLQSYVMNAPFYSCCLRFSKQEQTLYLGKSNSGENFCMLIVTFETDVANIKNYIASERRPYNQNAFIKINDLNVILLEREFYTHECT